MKRFNIAKATKIAVGTAVIVVLSHRASASFLTVPFNACTFYAPPFVAQSFGAGIPFAGCASFSAVRGRNGCTKTKGPCPACVVYLGDHLQMWLPEYFIEVTTAPGESTFTFSADSGLLTKHLALGNAWWKSRSLAPVQVLQRSMPDALTQSHMWHARILSMPYATVTSSYPPLPAVTGTNVPTCFAGMSEMMPDQWNYNLADAAYALAWAPVGGALCNSPFGAGLLGGVEAAKGQVSQFVGGGKFGGARVEVCARPVTASEALAKNLRPTSDALAPLTMGPLELSSKLCMGSWGNLLPRIGWAVTSDPLLSAMQAAYRFTSAAGDFSLNDDLKMRSDDKWQIVFPTSAPATCFKPGAPFPILATAPLENGAQRLAHELNPLSKRKGSYVIAVWRRRDTCEEPLETFGGWSAAQKINFTKNAAICSGFNAQGGWW